LCTYCTGELPHAIQVELSGIHELDDLGTSCGNCSLLNGTYLLNPTSDLCKYTLPIDPPVECSAGTDLAKLWNRINFEYGRTIVSGVGQYYYAVALQNDRGSTMGWLIPLGNPIRACDFGTFTATNIFGAYYYLYFPLSQFANCDGSRATITVTALY